MTTFDRLNELAHQQRAAGRMGEIFFHHGRFDQAEWVHFPPMRGDDAYETARRALQALYDEVDALSEAWAQMEATQKTQGRVTDELEQAAREWAERAQSLPARIAQGEAVFSQEYHRMTESWLKQFSAERQLALEQERAALLARVTAINAELLTMFDARGYMVAHHVARRGKLYAHITEALVRDPARGDIVPASQVGAARAAPAYSEATKS